MTVKERLLKYISVPSQSAHDVETVPTTPRQWDMAKLMEKELKSVGLEDVRVSDHCYVYGVLPATEGYEDVPAIGFIAHMDTSPDFSDEGVHPQIIENYDGGAVALGESGLVLSPENFPHLPSLKGRTLITTDGTTLLGADDKAGAAEIVTALEEIQKRNIPHGKICAGFTPDEEVGLGPSFFDVEHFGAVCAYTVDGGKEGGISYENFNAATADVTIQGFGVHPGSSKDKMVNASLVGIEFNAALPSLEIPRHTEEREGFFHLTEMEGDVSKAVFRYILRDHDGQKLQYRKDIMTHIAKILNEKYGEGTVQLVIKDQYVNMIEKIKPHFHVVEKARAAMESLGIEPRSNPIRGGTDGATLSYMGLPCPNLGTGGYAAHGPYEHVTVEGMESCTEILIQIAALYAEKE